MDCAILDELMKLTKKTDASKDKKTLFGEQIGQLLEEEGFSDRSIGYLRSGFGFSETKPIASYLASLDEDKRDKEIEKLIASNLFHGRDNGISFRFGISLLARISEGIDCNHKLLMELVKGLPHKSLNKDGKLLKETSKAFEKYYLDIVNDPIELPDMQAYGINVGAIKQFKKMLLVITEGVSPNYSEKISALRNWVADGELCPEDNNSMESASQKLTTIDEQPQKEIQVLDAHDTELVRLFTERVLATVNNLEQEKAKRNILQGQIDECRMEINQLRSQLEKGKEEYEKLEDVKEYLRQQVAVLKTEKEILFARVESQEQVITDQMEANSRLNSVVSVYSEDKQSSQVELLNAIASKLRPEYRDFKDAENEEMTIDLGENFRLQLDAVFKILAKAGIDIEKR